MNPDWHLRLDVASPLIPRLSPPQKPFAAHRAQTRTWTAWFLNYCAVATFEFAGADAKSGRNAEMNERPKLGSWEGGGDVCFWVCPEAVGRGAFEDTLSDV
jgi:hypothetical protein